MIDLDVNISVHFASIFWNLPPSLSAIIASREKWSIYQMKADTECILKNDRFCQLKADIKCQSADDINFEFIFPTVSENDGYT